MTDVSVRGWAALGLFHWFAAALFIITFGAPALAGEPILVQLDRATVIKLPERAATVVIGDPLIADLSVQPGGIGVITGKGYGATNVIVMDRDGAVLTEKTVEVEGPTDPIVVVYRGMARETYSCTPKCERRITLGDDPDYFGKTVDETTTRNSQAMGAGIQSSNNK